MVSSQNDIPNDQPVPKNIRNKTDTCEDEIDLIDYFRVLWRRKYFIALGSVLPALLSGLFFFLSPSDYKATYNYDVDQESYAVLPDGLDSAESPGQLAAEAEKDGLDEKGHRILIDRFNSAENLDKLTARLRESGSDEHAQEISKADIHLESPGELLTMSIVGRPRKDMQRICSIARENFEKVMPIYSVKEELSNTIAKFKAAMADIEKSRFSRMLELKRKRAISAKLKNVGPADSNGVLANVILHFDNVRQNSEYLPLAYQVQAADANIIYIEESIIADQEKYNYYESLVNLNERLLAEVMDKTSSHYAIQGFHSSLTDIVNNYEDKELADYLSAYIKRLENVMSTNTPVIEKPRVYPAPKGTVKKSVVVFAALLMITTFAVLLFEVVQQRQAPAS